MMKTLIGGFIFIIFFLGWLIYTHLDNPKLVPALLIMSIFIVAMLFAVFGKDLLKKTSNNKSSKESKKE